MLRQMPIFLLFVGAEVLSDGAFSLWVSLTLQHFHEKEKSYFIHISYKM